MLALRGGYLMEGNSVNSNLGSAGAVAGAIATPLIVLVLVATPAPEPEPAKTAIQLDIDLTSNEAFGDSDHQVKLLAPTILSLPDDGLLAVDPGGQNAAMITNATDPDCAGEYYEARLRLASSTETTCLSISGLRSGSTSTATFEVPTASDGKSIAVLTLNLRSRHKFWGPALAAFLAIVVAVGLATVSPWLRHRNTELYLLRLVRSASVKGWSTWVAEARDLSVADQIAKIRAVEAVASERADRHRGELKEKCAEVKKAKLVPTSHLILAEAIKEASDKSLMATDFVGIDGKAVVHPAQRLQNSLDVLTRLYHDVFIEARKIPDPEGVDGGMGNLVAAARYAVKDHGELLARLTHPIDDHQTEQVKNSFQQVLRAVRALGGAALNVQDAQPEAEPPESRPSEFEDLRNWAIRLLDQLEDAIGAINLGVLAVGILTGIITILAASYASNPTFGTLDDYVAIVLAGLASGSATTAATILSSVFGLPTE